ncbi:MAG TPA: ribosome maturation factor RimM [Pyrinomonadaceae bacterium]|nr:ribosome maturation factor RimM [Pyrinomonadaceae bacterium]
MNGVDDSAQSLVVVARAVRTRGLKGEVVAEMLTDFPERFENISQLIAVSPSGWRKDVKLESYWFQKDRVVLKLFDYDTIEAANDLVGCEFSVPEAERFPLPDNHYYDWELEGCLVQVGEGRLIGKVDRILRTGGVEILAVIDQEGKELLVPMADSIVKAVDVARKSILIDPPEGLLDL